MRVLLLRVALKRPLLLRAPPFAVLKWLTSFLPWLLCCYYCYCYYCYCYYYYCYYYCYCYYSSSSYYFFKRA